MSRHMVRARLLRPFLPDAALALAFGGAHSHCDADGRVGQAHADQRVISPWGLLLAALLLAFRRYYPLAVLAATVEAEAVATLSFGLMRGGADIALYTVAAHCDRRTEIRAGLAGGLALAAPILFTEGFQLGPSVQGLLFRLPLDAAAWAFGAYVGELRAKSTRLQHERESEMRRPARPSLSAIWRASSRSTCATTA